MPPASLLFSLPALANPPPALPLPARPIRLACLKRAAATQHNRWCQSGASGVGPTSKRGWETPMVKKRVKETNQTTQRTKTDTIYTVSSHTLRISRWSIDPKHIKNRATSQGRFVKLRERRVTVHLTRAAHHTQHHNSCTRQLVCAAGPWLHARSHIPAVWAHHR